MMESKLDKTEEVKRILMIPTCGHCPHSGTDIDVEHACKLFDIKRFGRKIPSDVLIPGWCPLPKATPPADEGLRDKLADFFSRKRYVTTEKAKGTIGELCDYADADSILAIVQQVIERDYVKLDKDQTLPEIPDTGIEPSGYYFASGYESGQQDMIKAGWKRGRINGE